VEERVNYTLVGLFTLVLGAALVGGVLWLSSEQSYRKSYDVYLVDMRESVSGLSLDSAVKYRGVEVGRVRRIALAAGNGEVVRLTLHIERGTPVKEDTVATLRTQGLTGIADVELSGGSAGSAPLLARAPEEHPVIPSAPSLLVRLDTALSALLTNANRTSESVNALLDEESRRAFKRALADLEVLAGTLAARSAAIDAGLAKAAIAMDNAARASGELPGLVARMQGSADGLERMAADVSRASSSVSGSVSDARGDIRQFTGEAQAQLGTAVADLGELAASLRRLSEQMERNPGALLYGKPAARPGPGE
jgi:phospholipid/cholesterol/gamma-HCH transport system substrate-binding protein